MTWQLGPSYKFSYIIRLLYDLLSFLEAEIKRTHELFFLCSPSNSHSYLLCILALYWLIIVARAGALVDDVDDEYTAFDIALSQIAVILRLEIG